MQAIQIEGLSETLKWLSDKQQNKMPAAAVYAINQTLTQARKQIYAEMKKVFDRPTPYTLRSIYITLADTNKLYGDIFVKDYATKGIAPIKYLSPEIEGGPRKQKGFEKLLTSQGYIRSDQFLLPWKAQTDAYGNVSAGTIQRILSGLQAQRDASQDSPSSGGTYRGTRSRRRIARRYFTTDRHGQVIIWERTAKHITPLFVSSGGPPQYKKRLRFSEIVKEVHDRLTYKNFIEKIGND